MSKLPIPDLGSYLREQRENAQLSLRQLAEAAGVSNPYLSQIERGLKKPSAEILQQIAKGLQVSAESLYVRAGILDERVADHDGPPRPDVLTAIAGDPALTDRQRAVLVDIYQSFVGAPAPTTTTTMTTAPTAAAPAAPAAATEATEATPSASRRSAATRRRGDAGQTTTTKEN